jgi:hypothetical protein
MTIPSKIISKDVEAFKMCLQDSSNALQDCVEVMATRTQEVWGAFKKPLSFETELALKKVNFRETYYKALNDCVRDFEEEEAKRMDGPDPDAATKLQQCFRTRLHSAF